MRTVLLLFALFYSICALQNERFENMSGTVNAVLAYKGHGSRSITKRSGVDRRCSPEHQRVLLDVLGLIANSCRLAMRATPTRPMSGPRLGGRVFSRFFGPDNWRARSYVHERFARIRREALRTRGLGGFGPYRVVLVCEESLTGAANECGPRDSLIYDPNNISIIVVRIRPPEGS